MLDGHPVDVDPLRANRVSGWSWLPSALRPWSGKGRLGAGIGGRGRNRCAASSPRYRHRDQSPHMRFIIRAAATTSAASVASNGSVPERRLDDTLTPTWLLHLRTESSPRRASDLLQKAEAAMACPRGRSRRQSGHRCDMTMFRPYPVQFVRPAVMILLGIWIIANPERFGTWWPAGLLLVVLGVLVSAMNDAATSHRSTSCRRGGAWARSPTSSACTGLHRPNNGNSVRAATPLPRRARRRRNPGRGRPEAVPSLRATSRVRSHHTSAHHRTAG